MSSVCKAVGKRGRPRKRPSLQESNIYDGVDEGCWWLDGVQKVRKKVGNRWGISRAPINLQNRMVTKKSASGPIVKVRLNWFSKTTSSLRFKYNHSKCKWVDVDSIILTIMLSYNPAQRMYVLDEVDFHSLIEFVDSKK